MNAIGNAIGFSLKVCFAILSVAIAAGMVEDEIKSYKANKENK